MKFCVENMTCGGCARSVTATLKNLDADALVQIDVESKWVDLQTRLTVEQVREALTEDGFPPIFE